jgi:hypothetical protein
MDSWLLKRPVSQQVRRTVSPQYQVCLRSGICFPASNLLSGLSQRF